MLIGCERVDGEMKKPTDKEMKEILKDVKFGSKLEAKWKDTLDKAEESILVDNMNIEISEAIIKIAKFRINIEKEKFK